MGKTDSFALEQGSDFLIDLLAHQPLIPRFGHELDPDDHRGILHFNHALRFQRLDKVIADHRIIQQRDAKFFDQLANAFDIGVIGHPQRQLHDHPVAAVVGHHLQLAKGDGVQRAQMVAQLERPDRDFLDRALHAAHIKVFPLAEGIVEQKERAGKDIAHQCLAAKADGNTDDPRTGEQRADIDPEFHQHDEGDGHDQNDQDKVAKQRQQRCQPAGRGRAAAFVAQFRLGLVGGFGLDLAVDPDAEGVIDDVADKQDHHHVQQLVRVAFDHQRCFCVPDIEERIGPRNKGEDTGYAPRQTFKAGETLAWHHCRLSVSLVQRHGIIRLRSVGGLGRVLVQGGISALLAAQIVQAAHHARAGKAAFNSIVDHTVDHDDRHQNTIGPRDQRHGAWVLEHQIIGQFEPGKNRVGHHQRCPGPRHKTPHGAAFRRGLALAQRV